MSKVEEDSFVDNYQNWGPGFRISFDLLILREIKELQSIFAFLGRHFANVPQILLDGLTLRVTTSYPLTGKSSVKYETEVDLHKWMAIVIETKLKTDNTVGWNSFLSLFKYPDVLFSSTSSFLLEEMNIQLRRSQPKPLRTSQRGILTTHSNQLPLSTRTL